MQQKWIESVEYCECYSPNTVSDAKQVLVLLQLSGGVITMGGLRVPKISEIFTTVSLMEPHARFTWDIDLPSTYSCIIEHANYDRMFFDFKIESLIFGKYFSRLFLLDVFLRYGVAKRLQKQSDGLATDRTQIYVHSALLATPYRRINS